MAKDFVTNRVFDKVHGDLAGRLERLEAATVGSIDPVPSTLRGLFPVSLEKRLSVLENALQGHNDTLAQLIKADTFLAARIAVLESRDKSGHELVAALTNAVNHALEVFKRVARGDLASPESQKTLLETLAEKATIAHIKETTERMEEADRQIGERLAEGKPPLENVDGLIRPIRNKPDKNPCASCVLVKGCPVPVACDRFIKCKKLYDLDSWFGKTSPEFPDTAPPLCYDRYPECYEANLARMMANWHHNEHSKQK